MRRNNVVAKINSRFVKKLPDWLNNLPVNRVDCDRSTDQENYPPLPPPNTYRKQDGDECSEVDVRLLFLPK